MHKFFVSEKKDNYFILDNEILNHIKVARLENDIFLCNFKGIFYECKLENKKGLILNKLDINNEYKNNLVLACPIIKQKRFEFILQKGTELGVKTFLPMKSRYTEKNNLDNNFNLKKYERYYEIIKNASEQSFRNKLASIERVHSFVEIIKYGKENNLNIYLAYENEDAKGSRLIPTNSLLIVGPEGGFSNEEINFAKMNKANIVSLGKTILRAETACIKLVSLVNEI
ncbi:16S rRNA (uracil(1498)-N(3))-methyltransferase [Mycoplasma sp. Mirounga ES2805-ORL]|uniref:16S rRNA (uracil(1498)-N(3))-methyltransferase n=1 Tax=Mycoplasma sp. Mirounga ES2805-ORL TaxID=754514 RepID=UPI00197B28D9|nr:16S rRNA (uracil(1498)-N(3))-methyltransferase [Mycoplasma sp. Mirounga ES2805-ORL]QSF13817.1 16S rRNA (uracil(1498)-N(3))-methyltransferase [Mycoplasma sp. Mirounga ES2805-ORL]